MVNDDIIKPDSGKDNRSTIANFGMLDNFFENMYEQMNKIDQYHHDMSRMMNSLRECYFGNDYFNKYFPERRSLLDYDFRKNRNTELFFPKPHSIFRGYKNMPPMDVIDKDKEIEIKMDVPGLNKENVQINLCNGRLEISGGSQKTEETKNEEHRYYVKERMESSFYRSFTLPENVCEDNIKATFKDGVLKIGIPKKEISEKKKIEIE
ncbi:small heat shock protein, putative [Plasmodium gallinaceum]|uniref:Small heat shock protein, putative n=1 Tax=Plasmodium gallinaceum TaxID=5849 RepID=A0A1J1GYW8_PLAGA|nr:small heat shock protein, putative [Plasmodium gallinaceum]CRG97433.1 small heat shock protein, putative [Plasmodium gallinaceum]